MLDHSLRKNSTVHAFWRSTHGCPAKFGRDIVFFYLADTVAMNEALMLLRKKRVSRELLAHGFGYACVCIWDLLRSGLHSTQTPGLSVEPDVRVR